MVFTRYATGGASDLLASHSLYKGHAANGLAKKICELSSQRDVSVHSAINVACMILE